MLQQLIGNLALIIDLSHSHYSVTAEVGVDNNGLRVGVADDSKTLITLERVEFVLKTRAEIVALQGVDATIEAALTVEGDHTGTFGAEV